MGGHSGLAGPGHSPQNGGVVSGVGASPIHPLRWAHTRPCCGIHRKDAKQSFILGEVQTTGRIIIIIFLYSLPGGGFIGGLG